MAIEIDFKDQVVMITGAAGGIGAGAAKCFAKAGASLVLSDLSEQVEQAAADFRAAGCKAVAVVADICEENSCKRVVDVAIAEFGQLDFAFNNAGMSGNAMPLEDVDFATWQKIIDINLTSVAYCMKCQVSAMKKSRKSGGVIINNSSVAGLMPLEGQSIEYAASKHGVIGLTKQAAINHAQDNIRINAVCPGLVLTDLVTAGMSGTGYDWYMRKIPMGRAGTPEDIGKIVVALCSNLCAYVTGATVPVDGGFLLS